MRRFMFFNQIIDETETKQIFVQCELLVKVTQTFEVPMDLNFNGMSKEEVYDILINSFPGENEIIYNDRMGPIEETQHIEFIDFEDFLEVYSDDNGDHFIPLNFN